MSKLTLSCLRSEWDHHKTQPILLHVGLKRTKLCQGTGIQTTETPIWSTIHTCTYDAREKKIAMNKFPIRHKLWTARIAEKSITQTWKISFAKCTKILRYPVECKLKIKWTKVETWDVTKFAMIFVFQMLFIISSLWNIVKIILHNKLFRFKITQ